MKNVKSLCQIIWQLENELALLDIEIQGVKVWQYMRMQIYYAIAEKSAVLQVPHAQKTTIYQYFKKLLAYIKGFIFFNPFFTFNRHIDEIVIDHPRANFFNGESIDIYTHYYLKELEEKGKKYLVLERPYLNDPHIKTNKVNRKYLDVFIVLSVLKQKFFPVHLNEDEKKIIKKIEKKINEQFEIDIDFFNILTKAIIKFKSNYVMYKYLFLKFQPKTLVVVVSYAYGDAIKAAKDLGVEVVEIQHGTISQYHLGYSFPERLDKLDYFPDKFITWGEYWKNLNVLPLPQKKILNKGFTHFNTLKEKYKYIIRKPNQIIVLSQGALGSQLSDVMLEQMESLKAYSIIYKLHPGEYSRWGDYKSLLILSKLPNVRIVKNEDIYKLFAESTFQIGVFSTALYEGLGFDCKTILLELPGMEYMNELIENKVVNVLYKGEKLLDILEEIAKTKNNSMLSSEIFGTNI